MATADFRTRHWRGLLSSVTVVAALLRLSFLPVPALASSVPGPTPAGVTAICTSPAHPYVAAVLSRDIRAALRGRYDTVAVLVDEPGARLQCSLNGSLPFDSASVVKVIILGTLLRLALDQHRNLTTTEAAEARAMITRSDNSAASALWAELGHAYLQHFLNLAKMAQTSLGPDGYWGLTQITAHDQMLLLRLLLSGNTVLDGPSRAYALGLMAQVIPSQRWGTPAGAPASVTVHVKNGWLPRATHGWRIHSIGGFTWPKGWYSIVILTQDNPTMAYGIATIEGIAQVIHRHLAPASRSVIPLSKASPSWGTPDEQMPVLPGHP